VIAGKNEQARGVGEKGENILLSIMKILAAPLIVGSEHTEKMFVVDSKKDYT